MKLIDVLNKQCNGEIRRGTKFIVDFSYEQNSPETYTYDGERFIDESHYEWFENHGASIEVISSEVKLIEPQLYYLKMPNSERVLGIFEEERKLVFEPIITYLSRDLIEMYLFTQDEIESLDILAPYRNFEWSEYREY